MNNNNYNIRNILVEVFDSYQNDACAGRFENFVQDHNINIYETNEAANMVKYIDGWIKELFDMRRVACMLSESVVDEREVQMLQHDHDFNERLQDAKNYLGWCFGEEEQGA